MQKCFNILIAIMLIAPILNSMEKCLQLQRTNKRKARYTLEELFTFQHLRALQEYKTSGRYQGPFLVKSPKNLPIETDSALKVKFAIGETTPQETEQLKQGVAELGPLLALKKACNQPLTLSEELEVEKWKAQLAAKYPEKKGS
jgi:hypothetical protein